MLQFYYKIITKVIALLQKCKAIVIDLRIIY